MTDEVIAKARERATKTPSADDLREAAMRAGAPVAVPPVDDSARETLRRMANGEQLDPMLRRLLVDALSRENNSDQAADPSTTVSDSARAATAWIGASLTQRGEALRDLLELADALPLRIPPMEIAFPRLRST
jgi:hypothetical protein